MFKTLNYPDIIKKKYENCRYSHQLIKENLPFVLSENIIYFALVWEQLASQYCDRFSICNLWVQGIPVSARGHMVLLYSHMETQLGHLKIYDQLSMLKGHKAIEQWLFLSCYVRKISSYCRVPLSTEEVINSNYTSLYFKWALQLIIKY